MKRKIEDRIGKQNESGWIIKETFMKNNKRYYLTECTCGCGEVRKIRYDNFDTYSRVCKKRQSEKYKKMSRENYKNRLIGKQYGLLLVKDFYGYNNNNQIIYKCECQCENKTTVLATYSQLTHGKDSCGCLTKSKMSKSKKRYNSYDLTGSFGIGYTSNTNKKFYFDLEDYDLIKDYCWNEHRNSKVKSDDGYIEARSLNGDNKIIKMHRLIMNVTDSKIKVDHVKHRLYDNRKSELRISSNQENCMNRSIPKNNTSGVSGVNWDSKKGLWRVRIYYQMKTIHLGYYSDFDEAVKIRKEAEEKYFGEWSYDNSMKSEGVLNE